MTPPTNQEMTGLMLMADHRNFRIYRIPSADMDILLRLLQRTRCTGQLTINFASGRIAGTMEWKQEVRPEDVSPNTGLQD